MRAAVPSAGNTCERPSVCERRWPRAGSSRGRAAPVARAHRRGTSSSATRPGGAARSMCSSASRRQPACWGDWRRRRSTAMTAGRPESGRPGDRGHLAGAVSGGQHLGNQGARSEQYPGAQGQGDREDRGHLAGAVSGGQHLGNQGARSEQYPGAHGQGDASTLSSWWTCGARCR